MRVLRLRLRFFRSFNFDYARKGHDRAKVLPWEMLEGGWWPFIAVDLDPQMTAIVGANESGKSQLVEALRQAITGDNITRRDFCRYSPLYSVQRSRVRTPDLGLDLVLDADDAEGLRAAGWEGARANATVTLIRFGDGRACRIQSDETVELDPPQLAALQERLPEPLDLPANVPLPDRG